MTEKTPKLRGAVIVTRVSSGEQVKHGTSLESQLEACRAKASALGLRIIAEYEDAGISGRLLLMRGGMQAALADIREGRADTLICPNISRYSRDREHQSAIKREVKAAGGQLVFCDMNFTDDAAGNLQFNITGDFAVYERELIRERTMRGKRKRAEEGQQPQRSRPAYGYHIVKNAEVDCGLYPPEMRGRYVVVEEKAAIVRRIFQEYVEGFSTLPRIARALNRDGVGTPGAGRAWMHPTLGVILSNPAYKGEPVSGRQQCGIDETRLGQRHKLTGRPITRPEVRRLVPEEDRLTLSCPPLVSEALWEAAQRRLEDNRTVLKGNPRQVQMLSGRTICPHCGEHTIMKYQTANGKKYRYFICGKRRRAAAETGDKLCSGDLYPVSFMEEATVRVVQEAWQKPEAIAAAELIYVGDENALSQDADALRKERARIDSALDELKDEEANTVRAQIAGIRAGASPDVYNELFADIAERGHCRL